MRVLYHGHFEERYRQIADQIPEGSSVVDLCAGDSLLYLRHLRHRGVRYIGLDISPRLVRWAQRHGVDAREFNLRRDPIPPADLILIQASLYQFLPDAAGIVRRMLSAARRSVIVSEPVHNLSSSSNRLVAGISRRLTTPDDAEGYTGERFDREGLMTLLRSTGTIERSFPIAGGRELMVILRGEGSD
jgi:hypothetical protein